MFFKTLIPLSLLVVLAPVRAGETLLEAGALSVTTEDLFFYLEDRVNPEVYESALAKPDAIKNSVVNLYVIRRAAQRALERGLISQEKVAFYRQDGPDRVAVGLYVDDETEKLFDSTDWEALAREQYAIESEKYLSIEQVRVEHVLINSHTRSFDELVGRVEEVKAALDSGEAFPEVAKAFSDDPSVVRNEGDLGFIARGQTDKPFEEAAFGLVTPGEMTEPVLSRVGVHFIRLIDRREVEPRDFESVKAQMIKQLKKTRGSMFRSEIMAPIRAEGEALLVDIDQEAIANEMLERLLGQR